MKANKKQCHWAFAEFQRQVEEKLKEVPGENRLSIRCLAKSVSDDVKSENPEGNPNQNTDGTFIETPRGIKWIYSQKCKKWGIVKSRNADDVSLPTSAPPTSNARCHAQRPTSGGGGSSTGNNKWVSN
jgi:hypothetical protein